jgi:hypothetical protein
MTDVITEPLPPQRPLARYTQLETDLFCENCGYNLHGQPVHRDERLGILLCRCPECGRFHPAGHRTTATSVWLSRFAAGLLGFWLLIVLAIIITAAIVFGAITMLHFDEFTHGVQVANDREVEYKAIPGKANNSWAPYYKDTGEQAPPEIDYRYKLREFKPRDLSEVRWVLALMAFLAVGTGFLTGLLAVVFLWHWPRRRYVYITLLPFAAGAFVVVMVLTYDYYLWIRSWMLQRTLYYAVLECIAVIGGIYLGRPIARLLIRMFIPPRPRQHLAFLWRIDNKTPPAAAVRT